MVKQPERNTIRILVVAVAWLSFSAQAVAEKGRAIYIPAKSVVLVAEDPDTQEEEFAVLRLEAPRFLITRSQLDGAIATAVALEEAKRREAARGNTDRATHTGLLVTAALSFIGGFAAKRWLF